MKKIILTWASNSLGGAEKSTLKLSDAFQASFFITKLLIFTDNLTVKDYFTNQSFERKYNIYVTSNILEYINLIKDNKEFFLLTNHRTFLIDIPLNNNIGIIYRTIPLSNHATTILNLNANWEKYDNNHIVFRKLKLIKYHFTISNFSIKYIENQFDITINNVLYNILDEITVKKNLINNSNNFFIVSRLVKWKRIDIVIQAFCLYINQGGIGKLFIYGDGEERENLESLSNQYCPQNKIIFCGWKENISEIYIKHDIYIHPPCYEAFGRSAVDAILHNKPILATKNGGYYDFLVQSRYNYIYDDKNTIFSLKDILFKIEKNKEFDYFLIHKKIKYLCNEKFIVKEFLSTIYLKT